MTVTSTRVHLEIREEKKKKRMDLEYVFVDFADEYWRGSGKENRRIK